MEIKVNVTLDLSEKTVNMLSTLFGIKAPAAETPVKPIKKSTAPAASTGNSAEEITKEVAADAAGKAVTLQDIKTKIIALRDAGKKEKTVALMQEYSAEKLSMLPEDKYPEFMEKLNAIK